MKKHYCQDDDCTDLQSDGWEHEGYAEGSRHPSGLCHFCCWWRSPKNALNFLFVSEELEEQGLTAQGWVRTTILDQTTGIIDVDGCENTDPSKAKVYPTEEAAEAEADFSLNFHGCETEMVMGVIDLEKFLAADPTW